MEDNLGASAGPTGPSPFGSSQQAVSPIPASVPCAARAFAEIARFAAEAVAVREAGFTTEALHHPRDELGLIALCAFNGTTPDKAPRGWNYYPNAGTKKQWERVLTAIAMETRRAEATDSVAKR